MSIPSITMLMAILLSASMSILSIHSITPTTLSSITMIVTMTIITMVIPSTIITMVIPSTIITMIIIMTTPFTIIPLIAIYRDVNQCFMTFV